MVAISTPSPTPDKANQRSRGDKVSIELEVNADNELFNLSFSVNFL
jgi:hypothetical protein